MPVEPAFLMVSRLLGAKGVKEYVAAAEQVKAIHPEAKFRIAGWFEKGNDCIQPKEIDEWCSRGAVEYIGRLNDVRPALNSARFFVLPTYYPEGIPRTILEAMSTGRPVITTDLPGGRAAVTHGLNGLLVAPRDSQSLAKAMLTLIENPKLAEKMGRQSRIIASEKFDVHKVNNFMISAMGL
jgi:glycosyltransferase involved in cell wall biosynthesis